MPFIHVSDNMGYLHTHTHIHTHTHTHTHAHTHAHTHTHNANSFRCQIDSNSGITEQNQVELCTSYVNLLGHGVVDVFADAVPHLCVGMCTCPCVKMSSLLADAVPHLSTRTTFTHTEKERNKSARERERQRQRAHTERERGAGVAYESKFTPPMLVKLV